MPPLTGSGYLLLYIILFVLIVLLFVVLRKKIRQALNWSAVKLRRGTARIARGIATLLQRLERKLTRNIATEGDDLYEELTPLDNADQDKVYDKQLKWALGKNNIRNIAVTGTYGSGKSSVLKTFQRNHQEFKYLNISLASFPENPGATDPGNRNDLVEFSILQQIILHLDHGKLPGSRFHRIRHQNKWKTFVLALGVTVFLFIGVYIFDRTFFNYLIGLLSWTDKNNWLNILPWLFLMGCVIAFYSLLRVYSNSVISKVKIPAAELEVERREASVLNRQIEEIIYFFQVTDYDVVILEDLDRFGEPGIFTKLREINLLINNAQQVKRNVVFIYVLGDHIFKGENRTKFFDYFVPVIPVVNSSNSYQLLTDRLKKANLSNSLPEQFIDEVSLYISDMRLLKNIMNEFNLYYSKLKAGKISNLNDCYLFSLVLYKNIDPEDFSQLQTGKGVVVKEFERKMEYINSLTKKLRARNEELNKLISDEQVVLQNNVEELRMVYLTKWLGMQRAKAVSFELDSDVYSVNELVKEDLFIKVRAKKSGRFYYTYSGSNISSDNMKSNFASAENVIDPAMSYDRKEDAIKARSSNLTDQWKGELEKNNEEIRRIGGLSLKELLKNVETSEISDELRSRRLLEFLLRSGYINEEYPYYISHFYPGSLLVTEHEFILDLKERKPKPYNYTLTNIPVILKRLYPQDYREDAILNFYLVDHLLNQPESSDLASVLQLLSNGRKYSTDFVDQFIQLDKSTAVFTERLSLYWDGWWDYLQEHPTATEEYKTKCYLLLLKHASVVRLKAMNAKGNISAWMAELRDFDIPDEKLKTILSELSVKIRVASDESLVSNELADHLCNNHLYELNPEMIGLLLRRKTTEPEQVAAFPTQPYSTIRSSGIAGMNEYINAYPDLFVSQVVLKLEPALEEPEEPVIELLGNENISLENRIALIRKMTLRVSNVNRLIKDLWNPALQENKAMPIWANLRTYYSEISTVDDVLARYVNRMENVQQLADNYQPGNEEHFTTAEALVNSPLLIATAFEKIVPVLGRALTKVSIEELDDHKLGILVQHSFVPFDKDHFTKLRSKSRELSNTYLIINKGYLSKAMDNFELEAKDYYGLLNSDQLTKEEKFTFLTRIPDEHYQFSPLATIVAGYVLFENASISFNTRISIVQYCSDKELAVMMAIQQLQAEPSVIDQMLVVMGDNYAGLTEPDQKIVFFNSPNNRTLISKLRETGHIFRVSTKDDSITVFTRKTE